MPDITYDVQVALGGTLTSIPTAETSYVSHGRQRSTDQFPAGTARFVVDDPDGDYVPGGGGTWTAETYIGRQAIVNADAGAGPVTLFRGFVEDPGIAGRGTATLLLDAADPLTLFAQTTILDDGGWPYERSGQRVARVMQLATVAHPYLAATVSASGGGGFYGGFYAGFSQTTGSAVPNVQLDTGQVFVQPETGPVQSNALQYLQRVAESERGVIRAARGLVRFVDRAGDVNALTPPVVTFTEDGAGAGEVPCDDYAIRFGSELLANRSERTSRDRATQTATDTTSRDRYGLRTLTGSQLLTLQPAYDLSAAEADVARYAEPDLVVEEVTVELRTVTVDQADTLLRLDVGAAVGVQVPLPGGAGTSDLPSVVEHVEHVISGLSHRATFRLSPLSPAYARADDAATWPLDDPATVAGP